MAIQTIYHFAWNNRRCYWLGNKNKRLLFSPLSSVISYSHVCCVFLSSFRSQMDIGGKYTKCKVTFTCCAAGRVDNSEIPPSGCPSPSYALWRKLRCQASYAGAGRWQEAYRKLRSTINFVLCPLNACKVSLTPKPPNCQDKQTHLMSW